MGAIPIDMIDLFSWPSSIDIEPCETTGMQIVTGDSDLKVPGSVRTSSCFADLIGACSTAKSRKNPSIWVVVKNLAQLVCSKIVLSHDAFQELIGKKPERGSTRLGLRYFSATT